MALATLFIALLALSGWLLHIPALASFIPGRTPIPIITLYGLILAGFSLLLQSDAASRWKRVSSAMLACLIVALTLFILLEKPLNLSFDVHLMLSKLIFPELTEDVVHPTPHAAAGLLLLGLALLFSGNRSRWTFFVTQLSSLLALLGALIIVNGYLYGSLEFYIVKGNFGISPPATLGTLLISLGILLTHPQRGVAGLVFSDQIGGWMLRRLLPIAVVLPMLLGWLTLNGMVKGWYNLNVEAALFSVLTMVIGIAGLLIMSFILNRKGSALALSEQRNRAVAAEIRSSNQLMDRIFSNIHVLVAYLDTHFNFIRVNENYAAADQHPVEYYVGKNHFALYPNTENEAIFRKVLESGEPYIAIAKPFEYPDQPERGISYWDWNITPVKNEQGKVEALLLTLANVTAAKLAELERLQAEAKFHLLFESSADAILIVGSEGRFIEVNQVACDRLGYSREELLALSPADINTPRFSALVPERMAQLHAQGKLTFETIHVRKDGQEIPVEINSSLMEINGKPAIISTARDITQRKLAEAALQASEARSRALLDATTETAMLMDEAGIVLAVNEIGAQRVHMTPDMMIGKNFYEIISADVAKRRKPLLQNIFQSGLPLHMRDERAGIIFDSSTYPVFNEQGKVTAIAVYAADVTQREQLKLADSLFNEIDQQILRGMPIHTLLGFICSEVARIFEYQFVWVGQKEPDGVISMAAWAGAAGDYHWELEKIGVRWDNTPEGHGPAGLTMRLRQTQVFKFYDPEFLPWHAAANRFNLKAIIGIPLILHDEIYGAFLLYSKYEDGFDDPATVQRLNSIASRICIALEMAEDQQQMLLLSSALSSAGNGVFITDRKGRIRWMNQSFTRMTGYEEQDALGKTPSIMKSGKQDAQYYQRLWQTITQGDVWCNETIEKRKDGSEFTAQQTITPVRDSSGEVAHFISIIEDISLQKATEARIQHMAHYDALTQLPNRALFYDRLQQVLAQAKRGGHPAALMFLDLDHFKSVNDTLGHHIGDLLLQHVADRIKSCVRETDTVSRLGGDEFTVLLSQISGQGNAATVAEKIIAAFAEPFILDGHEVRSSASIGIALYPSDASDSETMMKFADAAMYAAKQIGRNNYCFFSQV